MRQSFFLDKKNNLVKPRHRFFLLKRGLRGGLRASKARLNHIGIALSLTFFLQKQLKRALLTTTAAGIGANSVKTINYIEIPNTLGEFFYCDMNFDMTKSPDAKAIMFYNQKFFDEDFFTGLTKYPNTVQQQALLVYLVLDLFSH